MPVQKECYLCGSTEYKRRPGRVRDKPELGIFECSHCGLVYLSSFEHIHDYFYQESWMHNRKPLDVRAWLREATWDDDRRFEYLKLLLSNRSLLDIGCGAGGFLMRTLGLTTQSDGVEPECRLMEHFKDNGLRVYGSLTDIPGEVRKCGYDIITLFHVLEHFPDPKSELVKISELLADGGQIIIEVPNADDVLLTVYHSKKFSEFSYWSCHLFLYSSKTLDMLFAQIGMKINYIKQVQRYPVSNHLYWLSKGKPGGHQFWNFLNSSELHAAYEKQLGSVGKCDTIIASVSKP